MGNKKKSIGFGCACAGLGFVFSYALFTIFTSYPESSSFPTLALQLVIIGGAVYLAIILIKEFLIPYLDKRRHALMALGKDGIRIVNRDKTANLAYKGIYSFFSGKLAKSEEYLQRALSQADVRQNQMFCVEWLINLYNATKSEAKLLWCYRKAVEFSPDNPEAQSRLGHAYFSEGNLDSAMYCFEQTLRYDPNNGYAYFNIVKIRLIRGEYDEAFETLNKLVKINENHPLVHSEFANYYAMLGNREKAEEECKKAQLCGIHDPEEINRRINAILSFNETGFSGEDLPKLYYRKIEKKQKE